MEKINLALQIVLIIILLFSGVFLLGIIWRTEMKLDKSYKLFFLALVFLIIAEISRTILLENLKLEIIRDIAKILFASFFLGGILEARSMLRDVDGEKQ